MSFKALRSFAFAAALLALIPAARAQEQSATPPAPASTTQSTPAPADAPPSPSTTPAAGKRVWTNEDMGEVHRNSTISTFNAPNAKDPKSSSKPATAAKSKDAKRYQDQINALRAKLPPIDEKITQLKAVLAGDTVQQTRTYGGNRIDDWHEELVHLQKQRDDIEAKISAVQDDARHNGVAESEIPQ
jgi:hypothetical protein